MGGKCEKQRQREGNNGDVYSAHTCLFLLAATLFSVYPDTSTIHVTEHHSHSLFVSFKHTLIVIKLEHKSNKNHFIKQI